MIHFKTTTWELSENHSLKHVHFYKLIPVVRNKKKKEEKVKTHCLSSGLWCCWVRVCAADAGWCSAMQSAAAHIYAQSIMNQGVLRKQSRLFSEGLTSVFLHMKFPGEQRFWLRVSVKVCPCFITRPSGRAHTFITFIIHTSVWPLASSPRGRHSNTCQTISDVITALKKTIQTNPDVIIISSHPVCLGV